MDFLVKRGRGLDPAVLGWLMGTLGVGPGIGEVHFLVKADSAYYSWLRDDMRVNPSLIHYSVPDGHDALTTKRNDVLLVYPGTYDETGVTPITWSKSQTYLVGMCNPQRHLHGDGTGGVWIRTTTVEGVSAMKNTAHRCQFHNLAFYQYGQHVDCLTAFKEEGYMNIFKGCQFMGHIRSETIALTTSSSLEIGGTEAGLADTFINCVIGGSGGTKRTAVNGTLLFSGSGLSKGKDIIFKNTQFMSWMEDADPCAVLFAESVAVDRLQLFDGCTFYNFNTNHSGTQPSYVFAYAQSIGGVATHDVLLKGGTARLGFGAWAEENKNIFSADAKGETDGGEGVAADES